MYKGQSRNRTETLETSILIKTLIIINMHYPTIALALFSAIVVAQEISLPACAETCFATGAEGSGCSSVEDLECLCE